MIIYRVIPYVLTYLLSSFLFFFSSKPTLLSSTQGKTQAVVSIIAAVRGKSSGYLKAVSGYGDARACLQGLAADALVDDGQNIMVSELIYIHTDRLFRHLC